MRPLSHRRWILLSLIHPALSACLLLLPALLGHASLHSFLGVVLYYALLATFCINFPGIALLHAIFRLDWNAHKTLGVILMVILTWLIVVLPACILISRIQRRKATAQSPATAPKT